MGSESTLDLTTFAGELRTTLERFGAVLDDMPWETERAYACWLAQTLGFASHSTRLLALAASRFDMSQQGLHQRFVEHAGEERGHEKLLVSDLRRMGYSPEDLPVLPATHAFHQVQYYWIEHRHPASFFGYVLLLEGLAARWGRDLQERAVAAYGADATRFLKVHVAEDPGHVDRAVEQLGFLDFSVLALVGQNFALSAALYQSILEGIRTWAGGRADPSALAI